MGEPKADVHASDMISDAISQPEEAAGLETTPMAVEAAAAAGATAESATESTPEVMVEAITEATPEATPQATTESKAEATTTEATRQATAESKAVASTEARAEATTETKPAAVVDGAEGSHAPTGGDDVVVDEVSVVLFCGYFIPAQPCSSQALVSRHQLLPPHHMYHTIIRSKSHQQCTRTSYSYCSAPEAEIDSPRSVCPVYMM